MIPSSIKVYFFKFASFLIYFLKKQVDKSPWVVGGGAVFVATDQVILNWLFLVLDKNL